MRASYLFILLFILIYNTGYNQACNGVEADAGPDVFTCDPSMPPQLMGSFQGMVDKFSWTPTTFLSDPMSLTPFVNARPGKYKYKLLVEGTSTINLIRNGDFEAGNSGFTHEYVYGNPGGPFGPGNLSVGVDPIAYNGGFSNCGDHTSGSGNQLIVDGSTSPNTKIWCQFVPVTIGSTYLFRFYVQSVYPVAPAQLNVRANGTSIGSISAGAVCDWRMFEECFRATTANVEMCISETSGIGFGNDFAIDDIEMFEKCMDEDEVEVEIVEVIAKINVPKSPKCQSDIFDLNAAGSSSGPFIRYEWSTDGGRIISQVGSMAKGQGSGFYKVKIIYDNGFALCEKEAEIEVVAAEDLTGLLEVEGIANCNNDTIQLTLHIQNGSGRYSYNWAPLNKILRGQNDSIAYVTESGLYKAIIIDKESGCQVDVNEIVISDTLKPIPSISGDTLINCLANTVNLFSNYKDTNRYNLIWTLPDSSTQRDTVVRSQQAGKYVLEITDKSNKCKGISLFQVKIDTVIPIMNLGKDQIVDCKNNLVDIFAEIPDTNRLYTFNWNINGNSLPTENTNIVKSIQQNSVVILQLINKTNGCFVYDTVEILDIRVFPVIDAGPSDTITCIKNSISLLGTSNILTQKVNWFSRGGQSIINNNQLQAIVDQPGWYFIEVTDTSNYCISIDSVFIMENITKPNAVLGNSFTFSCKDSMLLIESLGSSTGPNIQYNWTTLDGKISGSNQGTSINILGAGTYQLTIVDGENGCSDSASITIIPDRNSPVISASTLDTLDCITKTVDLLGTANSPTGNPLSILWTSLDGYTLNNPTQLQTQVTNAGTYQLTVVDQINGCSAVFQTTVVQDTLAPGADAGINETWNCASQQILLNGNSILSGGNLLYNWTTTNGNIINASNQKSIQAGSPGKYYFTVMNIQNGCSSKDSLDIISNILLPNASILPPDTLTCNVQLITLNGQGSSSGSQFSYRWFTFNGNIVGNTQANTSTVNQSGIYIIEIIDNSNQCKSYDTVMVTENKILPTIDAGLGGELTCLIKSIPLNANTLSSNTVQWSTIGGNLTGPTQNIQTTANKPGIYYCTVTNPQNGCSAKDSLLITENTNIPTDIHLEVEQPNCQGDKGSIRLIGIDGGEFPLSYFLNGQVVNSLQNNSLPEGFYTLLVRDKNGCETQDTFSIQNPGGISVQLIPSVSLDKGANFKIVPIYSLPTDSILWIKWSPADNLSCDDCPYPEIINFSDDITYVVSFANKNGCVTSASITFQVIKKYVYTPSIFSPNGDAINDSFYPVISTESLKAIRKMEIFDRWGELVFSSNSVTPNDPGSGWKGDMRGRNALPGVYIYILDIEWNSGEMQRLFGDVTLIR